MSLSVPRVFANRYEIHEPVGTGAFSLTYRATDMVLHRTVAVKVLRREFASHENYPARFAREAQSAARIHHPNVIPIFDTGIEGDVPFIVMQFVEGPTLREYVRNEGPLTIEESVSVVRQTLRGLAAIHEQGIVHRDVKPQNILLDEGFVAKLTDFGVAFVSRDAELTDAGMTVGTAAYMAPEQATGDAVGPTADIYAAGVVLYELLTGRLPFPGDNPVQVMYRHVSEIPPQPRALNRYIPIPLEAVVVKSLAKLPSDRYPNANAMANALSSQSILTAPAARPTTATTAQAPRVAVPQGPRRPPPPIRTAPQPAGGGQHPWLSWTLILLSLGLIVTVASVIAISGLGTTIGSGGDPTDVPVAGGAIVTDEPTSTSPPTATESPPATEVVEPTVEATQPPDPVQTATPLPTEPPATVVPTETAEPANPTPTPTNAGPPENDFGKPLPGQAIPGAWAKGDFFSFSRDDFVEGGAYRRTDGVLYDRPAAHLYSQETEFSATTVTFSALETPDNYIGIRIVGMDDEWADHVDCRLSLNDHVIWEGESPFGNEEWTDVAWRAKNITWLQEGENTITFEIIAPTGEFGQPPWILLTELTVYVG